jgi:small conductance mechanosensitive channel
MGDDLGLPPVTADNVLLGLAVLVGGIAASFVIRFLVRTVLGWRDASPSSCRVFGLVAQWVVVVLAFVAALTVTFPSVRPVNALGGIGIISIAAGIAFQTVLGNMFAGLVILARDSFRVGDQIEVEGISGQVTHIRLSNTAVRTFDGRKVLVPNATLHSRLVTVQTG